MKRISTNRPLLIGNIFGRTTGSGFAGNVYAKEGCCPTLNCMEGGWREPLIMEISYGEDNNNRDA